MSAFTITAMRSSERDLTVERARTDRYRIEERTVFIVCKEGPALARTELPRFFGVSLVGNTWTSNGEEIAVCDSLESAQDAMRRSALRKC